MSSPPRSEQPRGGRRAVQILWLLLLAFVGAGLLVGIASLTEPERTALALAPAPASNRSDPEGSARPPSADQGRPPGPAPTRGSDLPAKEPTPAPSRAPAAAPSQAPAPAPEDQGRCAEPSFRSLARALVRDCERACKKDDGPLVDLGPETFEALFGREDDAGVATHFSFFGCNTWAGDGESCRGFDSAVADPAHCPSGAPTCRADAGALAAELRAFLERNRDAHTVLLFGTASKAGNDRRQMSADNARLAEERALAVAEVVHKWRREVGARDLRVLSVALDNTRTDYWQSPAFRAVIAAQADKIGTSNRTFSPLAPNAVNRSVMAVALRCSGLD